MTNLSSLSLSEIAGIIADNWSKVHFAASPYLAAMFSLNSIHDNYGFDSGRSIVLYFLGNATSWKGDVAKAVKAELKNRLKR